MSDNLLLNNIIIPPITMKIGRASCRERVLAMV